MIRVDTAARGRPGRATQVALGAVAVAGIAAWYRRWSLTWGATEAEARRAMPGDDVVRAATFNATRAVTVHATAEEVWPWIVQIGFGRAGWYSYDVLDNLGRPSAERIVPELQHLAVGDLVPLGPGEDAGMRVRAFESGRWVVWQDRDQRTTWAWQLEPGEDGRTRLLTRVRSRASWRRPSTFAWLLLTEVADFPMMRKCLLGIKRRAEQGEPRPTG